MKLFIHSLHIVVKPAEKSTTRLVQQVWMQACSESIILVTSLLLVTLSFQHKPVQFVQSGYCFQRGHTSPAALDWPLCHHSLYWVPCCSAFKSCSISSSFYSQAAGDNLPPCPTEEPSTPMWSPLPASWWSRVGRRRGQESWQRCWTRCALRWRPSPALCAKLGSPTCE